MIQLDPRLAGKPILTTFKIISIEELMDEESNNQNLDMNYLSIQIMRSIIPSTHTGIDHTHMYYKRSKNRNNATHA